MSTRANIKIVGNHGSILLYKHHDGYPKNMIPFLTEWLSKSGKSVEWIARQMIKETECEVAACLHGDIEYYYEMDVEYDVIRSFNVVYDKDSNQRLDRIFPEVLI